MVHTIKILQTSHHCFHMFHHMKQMQQHLTGAAAEPLPDPCMHNPGSFARTRSQLKKSWCECAFYIVYSNNCISLNSWWFADLEAIALRMSHIKNKILVLSGKGGVGKSTFAAQLAFALADQGKEVSFILIPLLGNCCRTGRRLRPILTVLLLGVVVSCATSYICLLVLGVEGMVPFSLGIVYHIEILTPYCSA